MKVQRIEQIVPKIAVTLLSVSLFSTVAAEAQISRTVPAPRIMREDLPSGEKSDAAREWALRLKKDDERLRAGEWDKPRRDLDRMIPEMLAGIEIDASTASTLGLALTFRALAGAGGGDAVAGRWDWLAAQALQPDLNEVSLDPYGAAKKPLEPFRRGADGSVSAHALREIGVPPGDPLPEQTPPRKIAGEEARYPRSLKPTCAKGTARIVVAVDASGRPAYPRWLDATGDPLMALALFESVRSWKFEPARRAGIAVPADLVIERTFDPGKCRPRAEKP